MTRGPAPDYANASQPKLRRILGPVSVACVGIGAAIGSGIFATPGEAAKHLQSAGWILVTWLVAGFITLLQTLVTAELATRFPKAGGEYQYLKEAYGEFAAFFFGWSFTIFIVGGGAGSIAALFGDFASELLRLSGPWASPVLGCGAVVAVVLLNAAGLRAGAMTQNVLTLLKIAVLLIVAVGAVWVAGSVRPKAVHVDSIAQGGSLSKAFLLALLPVFWSYTGATDSAKLAEETRDVHRALPLALCGSAVLLTAVYLLYNYALLCAASPTDMAGQRSVPSLIFARAGAGAVGDLMLVASALVCLGAVSSTILANVRVTFALARDGLTFHGLARMSRGQAPVPALLVGGALACCFVLTRRFEQILHIYFLASTVLFGLTYLSLIVFRARDVRSGRSFPPDAFRLPSGVVIAAALIVMEIALAASIVVSDLQGGGRDSLRTLIMLAVVGLLYLAWRRAVPFRSAGCNERSAPER